MIPMRPPLRFHVHDSTGRRVASFFYASDAAILVDAYGEGTSIRFGRKCVWLEGSEDQPAGESYDHLCEVVHARIVGALPPARPLHNRSEVG